MLETALPRAPLSKNFASLAEVGVPPIQFAEVDQLVLPERLFVAFQTMVAASRKAGNNSHAARSERAGNRAQSLFRVITLNLCLPPPGTSHTFDRPPTGPYSIRRPI